MGYFKYIADQAFKEGEHGSTLFYLGGPWSRPLVIESEEHLNSTYSKHLWMQRVFLSLLILGQPFLFLAIPGITSKLLGFLGYLLIVIAVQWLIQRIVFRSELTQLKRRSQRLPLKKFYAQMAERHSTGALILGLIVCILFVVCGIWMALDTSVGNPAIGLICSIFFGACGMAWGYALKLKVSTLTDSEQSSGGNG